MQHEIDWAVGQVFKALKSSRIQNNTFVFLTADNGYVFPSLYSQTVCVAGSIEAKHLFPSFLPAGLTWTRGFVEAMQVPLGVERVPLGREGSGPLALLGGPTRSNMEELTRWIAAAQWPYLNGSCQCLLSPCHATSAANEACYWLKCNLQSRCLFICTLAFQHESVRHKYSTVSMTHMSAYTAWYEITVCSDTHTIVTVGCSRFRLP